MKKIIIGLFYTLIIVYSFLLYGYLFRWFISSRSVISILACGIDGFILSVSVLDLLRNIKS